ncbi:ski complex subunit Rec14 [Schizosaccharomyces japonicus yFS275]|uniref:Ski complex subunit Rec14 n=1 Tax=Schizosaccharomyces japonicus (strain yFS275 / FY16936) TaxID=402676 RepID=B6K029_SCHJY|nr:ski complex subunit Rec14 [Schizosaccharomyces japonicus yFS275]EEB06179.1 ski complex subunit Rec14 [Schizosaccharomyces japonicus yFS275]
MRQEYVVSQVQEDAHELDIYAIKIVKDQLWSVSGDKKLKVWDAASDQHELLFEVETPHQLGAHKLDASLENELAVTCGFGQDVCLWNTSTGETAPLGSEWTHPGECWAACTSPDGNILAFTTVDGHLCIWDKQENTKIADLDTKGKLGLCIAYSSDGRFIASGHQTGQLFLVSSETGRLFHSLLGHTQPVRSVAFSPGSKLLAAAGDSKMITIYDVMSGDQVAQLSGHKSWVFAIAFNPVGDLLLSADSSGVIKIWDIDTLQCIGTQSETDGAIWSVAWYKTGFIVAGADRSIRWYRAAAAE